MVHCVKLGKETPGLRFPPLPNELDKRVYENVSQEAWNTWTRHRTMLINENRLGLAGPRAREYLVQRVESLLFGNGADRVQGYVPQEPEWPGIWMRPSETTFQTAFHYLSDCRRDRTGRLNLLPLRNFCNTILAETKIAVEINDVIGDQAESFTMKKQSAAKEKTK